MVNCFAIGCNHRSVKHTCSFYRFPKDKKEHSRWTSMSRRADRQPGKDSRLCSCHFLDGNKENGPSIFSYNEGKSFEIYKEIKKVCELQESGSEVEASAYNLKTGKTITVPLGKKHLMKNDVPSFTSSSREDPEKKRIRKDKEQLNIGLKQSLKICEVNSICSNILSGDEVVENPRRKVTRGKGKSNIETGREAYLTCNSNSTENGHFSQNKAPQMDDLNSSEISENNEITSETCDAAFYEKSLQVYKRDEAFAKFLACEISDLRGNPGLYLRTQQSILKVLVEAQFEQMSS